MTREKAREAWFDDYMGRLVNEGHMANMEGMEFKVLLLLMVARDPDTGIAELPTSEIIQRVGWKSGSDTTVRKIRGKLVAKGYLETVPTPPRTQALYRLTLPPAKW